MIPRGRGRARRDSLARFAAVLEELQGRIGFKVSARGWCYQLEQEGYITKADFAAAEGAINECRQRGLLPIDSVAEEEARAFSGVEVPTAETPKEYLLDWLRAALKAGDYYTPDWWEGERVYIQMVVEKIDLRTLFEPVCRRYHIPIATSIGWSSLLQRAEYARRFAEAEGRGLTPVLLYCGDHDPDGLRISQFLRSNLEDIMFIAWSDGQSGYDPRHLRIERFGLNAHFIEAQGLTWIDNLVTGSGRDLASPGHPNYRQGYVQDYLARYGARKCEANALVVRPAAARQLCEAAILTYLGPGAEGRFAAKRQAVVARFKDIIDRIGLEDYLARVAAAD